ncbi:hypothetical protein Hanom_Chr11g00983431 [Helianthus anomalus]
MQPNDFSLLLSHTLMCVFLVSFMNTMENLVSLSLTRLCVCFWCFSFFNNKDSGLLLSHTLVCVFLVFILNHEDRERMDDDDGGGGECTEEEDRERMRYFEFSKVLF